MNKIYTILIICSLFGCTKKLDLKPDSTLVVPKTVEDFENLLDNSTIMNASPGLAQMSADEYYIPTLANFQSLGNPITRSTYIWQKDIFEGQNKISDWTIPYAQIFYANSVIDELDRQGISDDIEKQRVKGWGLFVRAYAFYTLASIYSKAYDAGSASTDAGIPLKLTSGITQLVNRSSVQETYNQIIADAIAAGELLQRDIVTNKRNRPSKVAAYGLLARVYLSMRKYVEAEEYADKAMAIYSNLTDYNTLIIKTSTSFTYNSEEVLYFSNMRITTYSQTTYSSGALYGIDPVLIGTYGPNDLRKNVWFRQNANGNWTSKGINSAVTFPFTGLATDEVYLIKAECLARRNQTLESMDYLNQLLKKRWNPNATGTNIPYPNIVASSPSDALDRVLLERRKELIWRSIRWTDLKRLNLEGRNITLTRNIGGNIYSLEPNSARYVLPIPDDEIALSGIEQNVR